MNTITNSMVSRATTSLAATTRVKGATREAGSTDSASAAPQKGAAHEDASGGVRRNGSRPQKAAGLSSRRLSHLNMSHTLQALTGNRCSTGVAAEQASKHYRQHQRPNGIPGGPHNGKSGGAGGGERHQQQPPPWRGGSSISGCRGIDSCRRKGGLGASAHRMCLYGSGALWLPPQQMLAEYAVTPGVAGQPSGRDDLRTLLQEREQQDNGIVDIQRWRSVHGGGGRRNASSAVAEVLAHSSLEGTQQQDRRAVRSLRSYYSAEDLQKAFVQKLQLVDPLTGHMQVMATRRPGFAAAVVNIQDFDAYGSLQTTRPYAAFKQKDSLQAGIMAFVAPTEDAAICEKLPGHLKKRLGYAWASCARPVPYATCVDSTQEQQPHKPQKRRGKRYDNLNGFGHWQQPQQLSEAQPQKAAAPLQVGKAVSEGQRSFLQQQGQMCNITDKLQHMSLNTAADAPVCEKVAAAANVKGTSGVAAPSEKSSSAAQSGLYTPEEFNHDAATRATTPELRRHQQNQQESQKLRLDKAQEEMHYHLTRQQHNKLSKGRAADKDISQSPHQGAYAPYSGEVTTTSAVHVPPHDQQSHKTLQRGQRQLPPCSEERQINPLLPLAEKHQEQSYATQVAC